MGHTPGPPTRPFFAAWHNKKVVFLLLISTAVIGFLVIAFWQFGEICPDGSYCHNFADFRPAPSLHSDDKQGVTSSSSALPLTLSAPTSVKEIKETPTPTPTPTPIPTPTPSPSTEGEEQEEQHHDDPDCEHFPDTSNILLIMKTGASESYSKVPTQLLTNLRCLKDYLMFSDMEQTVAGAKIQDSLDTVLPEAMAGNKDFDLYHRQRGCAIDQETCNKNTNDDTAGQGWALDKYKNIHMAEKTYAQRPDYEWYLFVDADTYVLWSTLVGWLKELNPQDKHYLGSVALLGGFPFAHGGSGYLVSQGMMRDFLQDKSNVANKFDVSTKDTCCGDYMFSFALKNETGVDVKNVNPTINGEKPFTLGYHQDRWCHPIVTMHHIGSEEVSDFHTFEVERNFSSPVRIKDIYHRFVAPKLLSARSDWDNLSEDTWYMDETAKQYEDWQLNHRKNENDPLSEQEQRAHLSFLDCRIACHSVDDCLQFSFSDGICATSRSIRQGHPTKSTDDQSQQRMSGWDVDKINSWVHDHDDCGDISWPSV